LVKEKRAFGKVKKTSKKKLKRVGSEVSFYFCDGKVTSNLSEFANALEQINEDVFNYHVNSEKNDFVRWIEDVFGEKALAKRLRSRNSKNEYVVEILKFTANRRG